ncbi:MAG: methyltransferase [Kofleriaceae bacterium]
MIAPPPCSDEAVWHVWMAAFHAPTLAIADELGVFTALDAAPATASELATTLAIEPRATEAITGLLAALGFLARVDGRSCLTDVARTYLLPTSPYYWGPMLQRIRETPLDCQKLVAALRRGSAAGDARVTAMWEAPRPPAAQLVAFTHAMHAHSFALAMRTVPVFGLAGAHRLLDVAGGSGGYSIAAVLHQPKLRCTVLDLPPVCEVARAYTERFAVAPAIDMVPADMFAERWPDGHDRILFSDIFHDWDDDRCRLLAEHAFAALAPGGRVLVHELLLADSMDGPLTAVGYSMVMVFVARGRQRTARELSEILAAAGFVEIRITMTSGGYALIEGSKAEYR